MSMIEDYPVLSEQDREDARRWFEYLARLVFKPTPLSDPFLRVRPLLSPHVQTFLVVQALTELDSPMPDPDDLDMMTSLICDLRALIDGKLNGT